MKRLSNILVIIAIVALLFSCNISPMKKGEHVNEYVFPYLEFTLSEDGTYYSASIIKGASPDSVYIPTSVEKDGKAIPVKYFTGYQSDEDAKNLKNLVIESASTVLKMASSQVGALSAIKYNTFDTGAIWTNLPELGHTSTTEFLGWYTTDSETVVKNGDQIESGHSAVYAKLNSIELVHHEGVEATCLKDGSIEYWECSSCKKCFSDSEANTVVDSVVVTSPGSHSAVYIDEVKVSCTEDGVKAHYECSRCHTLFSDKDAKTEVKLADLSTTTLGHSWTIKSSASLLSCSYNECTRCGETSESTGHSWDEGKVQTAATATSSGTTLYTCTKCETTKTEDIAPLDTADHPHVWADVDFESETTRAAIEEHSILPTCTERGYTVRKCTDCEVTYHYNYKNALGHSTKLTEAKAPSCTENGNTRYYTCTVCEHLFKDTNGMNATTSDDVKKDRAALGHLYDENVYEKDSTSHWHVCLRCKTASEKKTHSYTEKSTASGYLKSSATCIQAPVYYYSCVCGEKSNSTFTSGSALGHSMTEHAAVPATCGKNGNILYYTCSRCNKYFSDSAGKTELSGEQIVDKASGNHTWSDWKSDAENHWKECSVCSVISDTGSHVYAYKTENSKEIKYCTTCEYKASEDSFDNSMFEVTAVFGNISAKKENNVWTITYTGSCSYCTWEYEKDGTKTSIANSTSEKKITFNPGDSGTYKVVCYATNDVKKETVTEISFVQISQN